MRRRNGLKISYRISTEPFTPYTFPISVRSNDNRKENKPTDVLVPSHLEKGKGEELGTNAMNWTKNRLDKYFVIHRYVKRVVMDRGEGTLWEPPKKSNDFEGVPKYEKEEYIRLA